MAEWQCDHSGTSHSDQVPFDNSDDQNTCMICGKAKGKTPSKTNGKTNGGGGKSPLPLILGVAALLLLGGGGYLWLNQGKTDEIIVEPPPPPPSPLTPSSNVLSSGETRLMTGQSNPNAENGVQAFQSGNYSQAIQEFNKAVQGDRRNPESQIYLNNAKARQAGSPLVIAVVVPIDNDQTSAEEMLRGIADAQTKFNDAGGLNGRLLEVIIANDGNDPTRAGNIAQQLANNSSILGVIGHNASDASKAALSEYEKVGLAMISPTSTSTELQGNVFARTVPSDAVSGQKLAEYAKNRLNLTKVAVVYNPQSTYSKSLETSFATQFQQQGGQIAKTLDLSNGSFDPLTEVIGLQGQVEGLVLLPNKKFTPVAIAIAVANSKLPQAQQFKLVGGDALYNPATLTSGGNAVLGLTLVVPWVAQTPYAQTAENRWGGQVSWRTAMSFDATSALIKAISLNPSRSSVLQNLKTVNLAASETSGEAVQFETNGDRKVQPLMVEVAPGGPFGFQFKPVN